MNAKASPAPGHDDMSPSNAAVLSQVAMVVMLVPIATPSAQAAPPVPPTYVDAHDQVWLLVDKASPMAAVFQQITAAEVPAHSYLPVAFGHSHWDTTVLGGQDHAEIALLGTVPLSRREIDVLQLIADGRSNQEIAQTLILALSTIKMHVKHIYGKLGVKNRVQAVAHARALGLLTPTMQ